MARVPSLGLFRASVLACSVTACGGGAPLLHPAHVLGEGVVSAGAGVSGQFVFGGGAAALDQHRASTSGAASSADQERAFLENAASRSALAPGVAPWVGARAGLGRRNEGGLIYTGRTARVDARHAFGDDSVALSVGLGASAVLMHPPSRGAASAPQPEAVSAAGRFTGATNNRSATGWGLDVPVIVGWRSAASIVEGWVGVRAGVERVTGYLALDPSPGAAPSDAAVSALRGYGGGLAGAAIGLRPFSVALEIDVAYQAVSSSANFPGASVGAGAPGRVDASVSGLTVAPSAAIVGKF